MGPNSQSGAVKEGFDNSEYHGSFDVKVATAPIKEAEYVIIPKIMNDKNLFLNIMIYISIHYE
tara:strand:+ start:49 stop:237 length:189 start_codon:yes stop_codon:yes gene_type:complete